MTYVNQEVKFELNMSVLPIMKVRKMGSPCNIPDRIGYYNLQIFSQGLVISAAPPIFPPPKKETLGTGGDCGSVRGPSAALSANPVTCKKSKAGFSVQYEET